MKRQKVRDIAGTITIPVSDIYKAIAQERACEDWGGAATLRHFFYRHGLKFDSEVLYRLTLEYEALYVRLARRGLEVPHGLE